MSPLFETELSLCVRSANSDDQSVLVAAECRGQKGTARNVVHHVDDDPMWRQQFAGLVGRMDDIAVGDLATANIVVVELWHRGEDGFRIVDRLKRRAKPPRVLALTNRCDPVAVYRSVMGALDGFVWKTADAAVRIQEALCSLVKGRRYFCTEIIAERRRLTGLPNAYFKLLSPAELELIPLFGKLLSDEEVGRRVGLHPRTIRWHRGEVVRRLGLAGSHEIPTWAMVTGFVPPHLPAPPCVVPVAAA